MTTYLFFFFFFKFDFGFFSPAQTDPGMRSIRYVCVCSLFCISHKMCSASNFQVFDNTRRIRFSLPIFYLENLFTYLITLQISRLIFLKTSLFCFFFATIFLMMMTFGFSIPRRETERKSVWVIGRV